MSYRKDYFFTLFGQAASFSVYPPNSAMLPRRRFVRGPALYRSRDAYPLQLTGFSLYIWRWRLGTGDFAFIQYGR